MTLKTHGQQSTDSAIVSSFAKYDTTKIAILKLRKTDYYAHKFDSTYKQATLNSSDIILIEKLLLTSIRQYNARCAKTGYRQSKINNFNKVYIRQYIPVVNKFGEKEVYIFCICKYPFHDKIDWKHKLILVDDGGSCVFRLKINLTLNKVISGIAIHGSA